LNELNGKEVLVPTFEQIVYVNGSTMKFHGRTHGIRNENLLHFMIDSVFNHFKDENLLDLSFLLFQKIVQLCPFVDENKKTATVTCDFMLKMNDVNVKVPDDLYYRLCYEIARKKLKEL